MYEEQPVMMYAWAADESCTKFLTVIILSQKIMWDHGKVLSLIEKLRLVSIVLWNPPNKKIMAHINLTILGHIIRLDIEGGGGGGGVGVGGRMVQWSCHILAFIFNIISCFNIIFSSPKIIWFHLGKHTFLPTSLSQKNGNKQRWWRKEDDESTWIWWGRWRRKRSRGR